MNLKDVLATEQHEIQVLYLFPVYIITTKAPPEFSHIVIFGSFSTYLSVVLASEQHENETLCLFFQYISLRRQRHLHLLI